MQIIVMGMHRSGTSAVTRLINLMGANVGPPEDLLPPNEHNPKGYWEKQSVADMNDTVLLAHDATWDKCLKFNPGKCADPAFDALRDEARKILFPLDCQRPWVMKDPRFCLTFPFWRPLLECPVVVLVHRNPVEVAKSLEKMHGVPYEVGLALWEKYTIDALDNADGKFDILLNYEDLVDEPFQVEATIDKHLTQLGVRGLRRPSMNEITGAISYDLRRTKIGRAEPGMAGEAQLALDHALFYKTISSYYRFTLSAESQRILEEYEAA